MLGSNIVIRGVRRFTILVFTILFLFLVLLGMFGTLAIFPYFQAQLRGHQQWSNLTLDTTTTLSANEFFVEVDGFEMYNTGYEYTEKNYGITTSHTYYGAITTGTRLLIVELGHPVDENVTEYVGTLKPITASIRREIINNIEAEDESLEGIFLPIMLNARDAYSFWRYLWGLLWLFALIGCTLVMLQAIQHFINPKSHWSMKRFSHRGDIDEVIANILEDLEGDVEQIGQLKLSRNWIILQNLFGIQAIHYDDLVWFHKEVTQTRVYGVPTGKIISSYIYDCHGKMLITSGKDTKIDLLIQTLMQKAPWAIAGHSERIANLWRNDRNYLVDSIEQRKKQFTEQDQHQLSEI